ncbi:MAG: GNAT family N-acetyltransferase [Rhodanobacter sp.]
MPSLPVTAPARVRRADLSDLDDLVTLEQNAFDGDRLSRAQYRRHLDSDSAQVLVASGGRHDFFGSAVLFFRKRSRVARVYSLATRPESRGLGIGAVLRHEGVHKQQWLRYGFLMPVLYLFAGRNALRNRFEIEAGLEDGGYVRRDGR